MKRSGAVAYLRVSTDLQRQELGAEAQRAAIVAWSERAGVPVRSWHTDATSGATPLEDRPGLLGALGAIGEQRAAFLVVAKLDRLARDLAVAVLIERELGRHGAELVSADGQGAGNDPSAQLTRSILLAVASFERQMIKARIRAALGVKKARGERVSRWLPFGYGLAADGRHLEPHAAEQRQIAALLEARAAGASWRKLAAKKIVTTRAGKPAHWTFLARLAAREEKP